MFAWKGETLEEYWWAAQLFRWPDGSGPNLILDDGGDATMLVHKGLEFEKAGSVPKYRRTTPKSGRLLGSRPRDPRRRQRVLLEDRTGIGVSEETTTGVHRLYQMME